MTQAQGKIGTRVWAIRGALMLIRVHSYSNRFRFGFQGQDWLAWCVLKRISSSINSKSCPRPITLVISVLPSVMQ